MRSVAAFLPNRSRPTARWRATAVAAAIVALVASAIDRIAAAPPLNSQSQTAAPSALPEFEVASIKLNADDRQPPSNAVSLAFLRAVAEGQKNGRFVMRGIGGIPLSVLIQLAYNVKEFQILGAPSWANVDRYEVDARAREGATFDQMRPMLQSMLADRFALTLRREIRQLPIYELVPARNGLKIVPMKPGGCVSQDQAKPFAPLNICGGVRRQIASPAPERRDVIEAVGVGVPKLLEFLSEEAGRVVLDRTGFAELFNFRLEFASTLASGLLNPDTPAVASSSGLSIFTAVEEQLGMRLRSATGPVEVLVIERVERPSAN